MLARSGLARMEGDIIMPIEKHEITARDQWLALRLKDLTASDLGAYLGLTPWKSPAELFAEKRGLKPPLENETRVMRRGRRDEYAILKILQEERPDWQIKHAKVYLRDPAIRLGCTPDAFAVDPKREGFGVVQCKSVTQDVFRSKWLTEEEGDFNVPLPYLLQTMAERMLAEAQWAVLAAWVRSAWTEDLYIIDIEKDEQAEANIRDLSVRFWKEVESDFVPSFDHKRDEKVVELFYPKEADENERDLSQDNEAVALAQEYVDLREVIKEAEERKKEIAAALKAKIGLAPSARIGDFKASWKSMVREEHLVERWEGRVLRVTKPRAKKKA